jgi:DNA-binding transcriptional ArsR family regulator
MSSGDCTPILKALADETRWRIVEYLLATDRANVTHLVNELHVSQPNISKHLRILREAGIVVSEKEGTVVWCHIVPEFRQKVRGGEPTLDLGCCTFKFDPPE